MADNTGKLNSASSIAKFMKSQGVDISATPMLRSANYEGITHIHLRKFLSEGF